MYFARHGIKKKRKNHREISWLPGNGDPRIEVVELGGSKGDFLVFLLETKAFMTSHNPSRKVQSRGSESRAHVPYKKKSDGPLCYADTS